MFVDMIQGLARCKTKNKPSASRQEMSDEKQQQKDLQVKRKYSSSTNLAKAWSSTFWGSSPRWKTDTETCWYDEFPGFLESLRSPAKLRPVRPQLDSEYLLDPHALVRFQMQGTGNQTWY